MSGLCALLRTGSISLAVCLRVLAQSSPESKLKVWCFATVGNRIHIPDMHSDIFQCNQCTVSNPGYGKG